MKSRRLGRRVVSYSQLCETLCPRHLAVDVFYTKFTTESQRNAEIAQRSFQLRTPPARPVSLQLPLYIRHHKRSYSFSRASTVMSSAHKLIGAGRLDGSRAG